MIAVAAVDNGGDLAGFSNSGKNSVDLAAPGDDILSTVPGPPGEGTYAYMSGTSMALPT